jgi:hypothetical protein
MAARARRRAKHQIPVKPLSQKYSAFPKCRNSDTSFLSRPETGAYRDRHGRGVGCDGRGLRQARSMIVGRMVLPADGEVVWS